MPTPSPERPGRVRTKIVATLGPVTASVAGVRALAEAGADAFRLNFSHGTHAEHDAALAAVRQVARELGRPLAVLQDLCGPKIRLGELCGGSLELMEGERIRLVPDALPGDARAFPFSHPQLLADLRPGEPVSLGDGEVTLRVISASRAEAVLETEQGGAVRSRQGVNLPRTELSLDALTAKDLADLDWTARQGAGAPEYVALSFVRRAEDVRTLRRALQRRGVPCHVVAKIEKPQAVASADEILAESDAIMVARGDLAIETDVAKVPAIQKRLVAACRAAGRPVITATQMLASMERSPMPTRAEASDVFNAVLDGSDAVMLSGETAVGAHPALAVATMSRILAEAEALLAERPLALTGPAFAAVSPTTRAVVAAASAACAELGSPVLVVATHSGKTALALSRMRHPTPTLAAARDPIVAGRLALSWGVVPILVPQAQDFGAALDAGLAWARAHDLIAPGDRVVLVQGGSPESPVHDGLFVREIS